MLCALLALVSSMMDSTSNTNVGDVSFADIRRYEPNEADALRSFTTHFTPVAEKASDGEGERIIAAEDRLDWS